MGVYAVKYSGGQVNISNGDFVFSLTEGYLIEDGKITAPLKGVNLIGNGPEALRTVSMVGTTSSCRTACGRAARTARASRRGRHAHRQARRAHRGRHRGLSDGPPASAIEKNLDELARLIAEHALEQLQAARVSITPRSRSAAGTSSRSACEGRGRAGQGGREQRAERARGPRRSERVATSSTTDFAPEALVEGFLKTRVVEMAEVSEPDAAGGASSSCRSWPMAQGRGPSSTCSTLATDQDPMPRGR